MIYDDINSNIMTNNDYNVDAVMNSIKNIIMTTPGELPGYPEFGTRLGELLFEPIDFQISEMIQDQILYALVKFEPRITVQDIIVQEDYDYNRVTVSLSFSINKIVEGETYNLSLNLTN